MSRPLSVALVSSPFPTIIVIRFLGRLTVEPYDSPTFLSRKDKILFGMTLKQMGLVMGGGFFWLMLALSLDQSLLTSFMIFTPLHLAIVVCGLVRPGGVMVPVYVGLMLKSFVTSPVYSVGSDELRGGLLEWFKDELALEAVPSAGSGLDSSAVRESGGFASRLLGGFLFFRKRAMETARSEAGQEARVIASLEAEQRAGDAVQNTERAARTVFNMLFKKSV